MPSIAWRREFSLLLGLERLLFEEEPHARRRHLLSAHQVDALSGTLTALLAEAAARTATATANGRAADGGARRRRRTPTRARLGRHPRRGGRRRGGRRADEEPQDWAEDDAPRGRRGRSRTPPEDPNAAKRFWFEHATGAGKTVAALGFVEASRTGGILILTHRRNLVDQFHGELRDRGYAQPHLRRRCSAARTAPTARSPSRPTSGSCATPGKISDAYTIVICDEAHTALGEKTSASIRNWPGPIFIGMTATGALIARHVTDLFPTQTSRFDLAQAARRGVIAPLRCVRIPPGPGVRTIAKVPLRRRSKMPTASISVIDGAPAPLSRGARLPHRKLASAVLLARRG